MTGKSEEDVGGGADRRELYGHFKTAADPQNQAVPDHRSHLHAVELFRDEPVAVYSAGMD
jgi:hypothetical protein